MWGRGRNLIQIAIVNLFLLHLALESDSRCETLFFSTGATPSQAQNKLASVRGDRSRGRVHHPGCANNESQTEPRAKTGNNHGRSHNPTFFHKQLTGLPPKSRPGRSSPSRLSPQKNEHQDLNPGTLRIAFLIP